MVHFASQNTHRDAEKSGLDLSEVRRRAWETRRAKYGERGHAGSYSRGASESGAVRMVIQLHAEGVLSEGQVQAATGLDRVEIRRRREAVEELAAFAALNARQQADTASPGLAGYEAEGGVNQNDPPSPTQERAA